MIDKLFNFIRAIPSRLHQYNTTLSGYEAQHFIDTVSLFKNQRTRPTRRRCAVAVQSFTPLAFIGSTDSKLRYQTCH